MFHRIYIERSVQDYTFTARLLKRIKAPVEIVDKVETVYKHVSRAADPVAEGKRNLLVTRNRGAFIRPCPGTRTYTCCNYQILHVGTYCTMDCAYCVLQGYFHPPVLQLFVNREDLSRELQQAFEERAFRRIGTGEFTDSLMWEAWTDMNGELITQFGSQDHMVLELKTKTVLVDALEALPHNRKTIVSWSLNTPSVIQTNEKGTASLEARLHAAEKCQSWGYPLAFHFDPLILYGGCETEYSAVVDRLFSQIEPDNVAWISLGSFRFPQDLKPIIQDRFPQSKIPYGEFVVGTDGKQRYFKPLRVQLYQHLVDRIRSHAPDAVVYFCMEDAVVWKRVMGHAPEDNSVLGQLLDESAVRVCGLIP